MAGQRLDGLALACRDLLTFGALHEFALPYAFAIAARARLHDPAFWTNTGDGTPKPELLEWLERLVELPAALNSRHNYYHEIVTGIRHYVAGDDAKAFHYFALAARPPDFYRVVKDDFGGGAAFARTFPSLAELAAARGSRFGRELHLRHAPRQPLRAVVSVSFDRIYAEAFAQGWIERLAKCGAEGVGLHLHLMFRNEPDEALLASLVATAASRGVPLALSLETGVCHARAYFASARFLRGAAILDAFRCPVLFSDADAYITQPQVFTEHHLPAILAERRVLGHLSDGPYHGYLPWRRFSATWMTAPWDDAARRFLGLVGDAVEYFWDQRDRNWWIDQMALQVARTIALRNGMPAGTFGSINQALPHLMTTGEDYKIRKVSGVPRLKILLDRGLSYWEALRQIDV
ncbi:hypothetical protein [Belnapia rosea]|uniref:hypothetical protein n=1 Tax=Belnapia rosea TaxID=938405 RepID=UPI00115F974D|nr:hypothetical protein [Belnapia rosea]